MDPRFREDDVQWVIESLVYHFFTFIKYVIFFTMIVYLAGSIPKGDKEAEGYVNWRLKYQEELERVFPNATFIDPFRLEKDENDPKLVFGEDCKHISEADLVVVRSEEKMGAGTSMELVIAKYLKKPVVTVLPKNSHHRRPNVTFAGRLVEDWIHPFVWAMSDYIVESIEGVEQIKDQVLKGKVRDITYVDQAIEYAKSQDIV
jgi:nucleoside 2-deoxyribosyltransferase